MPTELPSLAPAVVGALGTDTQRVIRIIDRPSYRGMAHRTAPNAQHGVHSFLSG